jgi:hypothetical protein
MGRRKTDFDQTGINKVRAQAALIPAVVLAQTGKTNDVKDTLIKALTDFYTSPTNANYNTVRDIYVLFNKRAYEFSNNLFFKVLCQTYEHLLISLNRPVAEKVAADVVAQSARLSLSQEQINKLTISR